MQSPAKKKLQQKKSIAVIVGKAEMRKQTGVTLEAARLVVHAALYEMVVRRDIASAHAVLPDVNNPDWKHPATGRSVLSVAVEANQLDLAKLLLRSGADPTFDRVLEQAEQAEARNPAMINLLHSYEKNRRPSDQVTRSSGAPRHSSDAEDIASVVGGSGAATVDLSAEGDSLSLQSPESGWQPASVAALPAQLFMSGEAQATEVDQSGFSDSEQERSFDSMPSDL
mmetsp:Transcript_129976/g.296373  ORF Transcript_129976/g.296373 Transcript_129976/m.296373 type:complete len:226 (-) Transcript_129976:33-710(-)